MRHLLCYVAAASAFKSSFINLGGVRHHVRDSGESDGPLAIFFHGFAGSCCSFEDVAPLLAAQKLQRCIAVDRIAFGLTERPAPASLPAPPKLPGSATLAASLEGGGGPQYLAGGLLPEARAAIASGLRRPETLAPSLPVDARGLPRRPVRSRVPAEGALDVAAAAPRTARTRCVRHWAQRGRAVRAAGVCRP